MPPVPENKTTVRLSATDLRNVRLIERTYSTSQVGAIRLALAETARRLLMKKGGMA